MALRQISSLFYRVSPVVSFGQLEIIKNVISVGDKNFKIENVLTINSYIVRS